MQLKTKFNTALIISLLSMSNLLWAAQDGEHTNVNVNISDGKGKVIIVKGANGNNQTIEESFTVEADTDVEVLVNEILSKHGINPDKNKQVHKITKMMGHPGNNMTWVQKNDDVNVNLVNGQATVVIKKDNNGEIETISQTMTLDEDSDINALVDQLMAEHGIEAGDAEVHRKIIKLDKHRTQIDNDQPRMGFMANVQDNGWQVISVVPDSGAAEAGMKNDDVIISIDGESTAKGGMGLSEFIAIDKNEGDVSDVVVLRDNKQIPLRVTAKVIDSPDIIMSLDSVSKDLKLTADEFHAKNGDLSELMAGLHVNVDQLNNMVKDFGDHEIHVVTTSDADAYFFSGSKMNQWLGKNHHFSTITESLGKYFGTSQGVLVLEVDQNNKLGLKDGDVIQAINGEDVNSPKDVVKIMSGFKSDEAFEIEIIREKETIYLES